MISSSFFGENSDYVTNVSERRTFVSRKAATNKDRGMDGRGKE